ncbi:hypothetical protein [Clostridium estertheticum]|uniref:hypothetical protein n=1 Tax=Clostridium estertheticum TaxID=238834 RepID=UPI001C6F363F|nr:hypothetical protein [Clostridium estertheticum]MBW9154775.1 hypothetical protein [Clostridium estertheticum]WLC83437.1 hypothetical protein KTC97_15270 [Clostridium estertheticum]
MSLIVVQLSIPALVHSEGDIYIQTSKGTWISNSTGLTVAKSLIDNITKPHNSQWRAHKSIELHLEY